MPCRSRMLMAVVFAGIVGCSLFDAAPEVTRDLRAPGLDTCPIHKVDLQEGVEKFQTDDQRWDEDYFESRRKLFPYAMTGDLVDQEATRAQVLYCPECRLARKRWLEKQK